MPQLQEVCQYPVIVEAWDKRLYGRVRKAYFEQFDQKERETIGRYHTKFRRWYLVSGHLAVAAGKMTWYACGSNNWPDGMTLLHCSRYCRRQAEEKERGLCKLRRRQEEHRLSELKRTRKPIRLLQDVKRSLRHGDREACRSLREEFAALATSPKGCPR
jgi:hypothetical protein